MKRRHILILLACTACLAGCHSGKFTVQADLETAGFKNVESVQVQSDAMDNPLTADVTDGRFSVSGKVKKPVFGHISLIGGQARQGYPLILERGTIVFRNKLATGTPLNDANAAFVRQIQEISAQHAGKDEASFKEAIDQAFLTYVTQHKSDPCAIYAILYANHRIAPETMQRLIDTLSPEIRNQSDIKSVARELNGAPRHE